MLLADAPIENLKDQDWLAAAIAELGLELPTRYPAAFPNSYGGLRIWQTPIQFAPYLIALSELDIRSYAEFGVHSGGSFIVTVEYLSRFTPVERAVAVDMSIQPTVAEYAASRENVETIQADTKSDRVHAWLAEHKPDLVFIDADHSFEGVSADYALASRHAKYVALHDVCEWTGPGVQAFWASIDAAKRAFTDQYDDGPTIHGIGLVGPLR